MEALISRISKGFAYIGNQCRISMCSVFLIILLIFSAASIHAAPLSSITVTGSDGTPVSDFRWLVEEDLTYNTIPGLNCFSPNYADCQALNFHKSYMPVIAEGHSPTLPDLDPAKRYYISVLPDSNYTIGGTNIAAGASTVSIKVGPVNVPTAQIRIFIFDDNAPINGVPDASEQGLAGIKITVEDAGGRFGISGQQITADVYGNPLGTTYNSSGDVVVMGDGNIYTGADGYVTIKNLAPAKYGIRAVPPTGSPLVQTSTIEGTKVVDAWVKPNEPPYFLEFGPARPPGPHVFIGFTQDFNNLPSGGTASITGTITSLHNSRPPVFTFHSGTPVGGCWVGLNQAVGGVASGDALFAAACDENSNFTIPNVPAGSYQIVIWDEDLTKVIAYKAITVATTDTTIALGDVPIFAWFGRIEQKVFNDTNENGIWDVGEVPMPEQGTAIRWRDGTVYQSFATDLGGEAPYDTVFPFFHWLVAEVAFDRFKATGATVRVDDGGAVQPGEPLNPQPQSENSNLGFRVETGPVLTQAFQVFAGQTNVIEWGKTPYAFGENGGISGIIYYATTRAENDPRYAGAEVWEPGIPRIQVALYQDNNDGAGGGPDGIIDDINGILGVQLADVDNAPFGNSPFPGSEDFDYNSNGINDAGDAIQITTTDSWDDNVPTNCQGAAFLADGVYTTDCFDGLRNFNQVRPGVFDGGYAFVSYFPGGLNSGNTEIDGLQSGTYIVASGEHVAYKTLKEEDRNVDFGDDFIIPNLLPPSCVGDDHTVPSVYSLFDSGEAPFYANQTRPVCDRKQVLLSGGKNAAADFYMFTQVPRAAHLTGVILNDLANEFDSTAPAFGEKFAPPNLPISFKDWQGNEVSRTYSDRWGMYNALVPSTYTNNLPSSSGISPNMLTSCMNDPGPININGEMVIDPAYKREYAQFCYTWQYMPGTTTYLDTPILPVAAFTGTGQFPLDCEYADGTPVIWSTSGANFTGPYVVTAGDELTLVSAGDIDVNNPDFNGQNQDTISRDFGFGEAPGTVSINGVTVPHTSWNNDMISVAIPESGQLEIHRANGLTTYAGIHVKVGTTSGGVIGVTPGGSIQQAINSAAVGDTVIVPPGTYNEAIVMWKPIRLQGSGASTVINASSSAGTNVIQNWRALVEAKVISGEIDLLTSQGTGFNDQTLLNEQAAGILVLAKSSGPNIFTGKETRIDGLTIQGSSIGGGIIVNGYAHGLEISNNRVSNNSGVYGGGIRIGHAVYDEDNINQNINIHNNYIAKNGSFVGAGAGISLYWGSDDYTVANNYVCGNFSTGDGGGIAHLGRSMGNNSITENSVLFNQSFNQGVNVAGGGIFVGGELELGGNITQGSGPVTITNNLIQGNNAGAGNGGGISLALVDGADVQTNSYPIIITGNKIINNVAGLAGGGISLQDAVNVDISNNTIAHNDSTATTGEAFCDIASGLVCDGNTSIPRTGGIVSYGHSISLAGMVGSGFSNPVLNNNIIWENRSFYFDLTDPITFGLLPDVSGGSPAVFDDLAVYPNTAGALNPMNSTLTDLTGYDASNTSTDPNFVLDYFNGASETGVQQTEFTTISSISIQPAFDEGGNFIEIRYGPLSPVGDYRQMPPSASLIAPSGDIGAVLNPDFTWNGVTDATDYRLWLKNISTSVVVFDTLYPAATVCSGAPCVLTSPVALADGDYQWFVQSKNGLIWGIESSTLVFTVNTPSTPPLAATLIGPSGDIGAVPNPDFSWNTVANATDYRLWLRNDTTGVVVFDTLFPEVTVCSGTPCVQTSPVALVDGDYRWFVRAKNGAVWGPNSSVMMFIVTGVP